MFAIGNSVDTAPSVQEGRIPAHVARGRRLEYFLIHHTAADTVDKIDPAEMARCAAAVAVMAYVIADLPERLGD